MKKFIVAIVALLYISTSTGATLYLHYCMGKLAGWGFGANNSKTCGGCGMEKSDEKDNGCCKDEHKILKNDSDQKTTKSVFLLRHLITVAQPTSFFEIPATYFTSITKENSILLASPRSTGIAMYLRNCVFLI